jgi:hypothetical protein
MKLIMRLVAVGVGLVFLGGCATRTEFTPDGGPVTVGMPAELTDRERGYMTEVDSALRGAGYVPVRHGAGELELDFRIEEGPINTDTTIVLQDGRTVLAEGRNRGSGIPLIGRDKVAERSFRKAFDDFQAALPGASSAGLPAGPAGGVPEDVEYVY